MIRASDPRLLLAVVSLALVGLLVARDARAPGPGALHPVHARIPELEGLDGCVRCHGQERTAEAMASACVACHDEIGSQLRGRTGLHGSLAIEPDAATSRCSHCHGEHHGSAIAPVSDVAFARAGFSGVGGYEHESLAFGLDGRHESLDCDACHEHAFAAVLPEGAARFLGLEQTCTACHADPHAGEMPQSCADCHGQSDPFASVAAFQHPPAFPLEAPHSGLACSACHPPGALAQSAVFAGAAPADVRTCADCHQPDHSPSFLARVEASCADCHTSGSTSFTGANFDASARHHSATGFTLDGAHAAAECSACHTGESLEDRFPGGRADRCTACHDDVHGGVFDAAHPADGALTLLSAPDCAGCHGTASFRPVRPGTFDHGRDAGFELTDAHARAECVDCHGPSRDHARSFGLVRATFDGPPQLCSTCHANPHGAGFTERVRGPDGVVRCDECHTRASFADSTGAFDHGDHAGFALEGAHAEALCVRCHAPSADGAARLGDVHATFPGDTARCDTCHVSPHGDRFLRITDDADPADCASCHSQSSFLDILPGTFDHAVATGFALGGAHAQARCTSCHVPPEDVSIRLGRVSDAFPGDTGRCSTCHADPHGGLFDEPDRPHAVEGRVGCARCHGPASFRATGEFDHGRWTGWPLDGAHRDAACAACHAVTPDGEVGRTNARAAGRACADCHADPHLGQFDRHLRTTGCASCHSSTGSFTATEFDHSTARFPLDAVHEKLECAACHQPTRTADGRTAIRYRPMAHGCADCHDPTDRRYRRTDSGRSPSRGADR